MEIENINATQDNDPQTVAAEVVEEVAEKEACGQYTGHTKWFNDKLGYGFITICDGDEKGKDIFVHHSGVKPLNSNYKTLRKGEYIQFNIITGMNGLQAVDVTGIKGGPLMCDYVTSKRVIPAPQPRHLSVNDGAGWQTIPRRNGPPRSFTNPPLPPPPPPPPRGKSARENSGRPAKNVAKYNKNTRP